MSRLDRILSCEILVTALLNEASMSGSWTAVVPIPTPGPEVGPVTLIPPVIDISFGTQDAVGAFTVSASRCAMYGAEPVVTITVK